MEDLKLKDNKCEAEFYCQHSKRDPCVYFFGKEATCKYKSKTTRCKSLVAIANRMTVDLMKLTGG